MQWLVVKKLMLEEVEPEFLVALSNGNNCCKLIQYQETYTG